MLAASSRQKGQNERRHDHLSSCIYRVFRRRVRVSTGTKRPKKNNRDDGCQREKEWGGGGGVTESEQRQTILYEIRALTGNQWS